MKCKRKTPIIDAWRYYDNELDNAPDWVKTLLENNNLVLGNKRENGKPYLVLFNGARMETANEGMYIIYDKEIGGIRALYEEYFESKYDIVENDTAFDPHTTPVGKRLDMDLHD